MKRLALLPVFVLLAGAPAFAQSDLAPVAVINLTKQKPITLKMLKETVNRLEQSTGRKLTETEKMAVLNDMINQELVLQAAARDRVTVSDAEVDQAISVDRNRMSQAAGRQLTDAEFGKIVQDQTGMSLAAYREQARGQVLAQKYVFTRKLTPAIASDLVSKQILDSAKSQELLKKGASMQDVAESLKVPTDADIRTYYEDHKAEAVQPPTAALTMILVPYAPNGPMNKTAAKAEADKLAARIGGNAAAFDSVARETQIALRNGKNLPYTANPIPYLPNDNQGSDMMGHDFITEVFKLEQGKVSKVLDSKLGWAIVKVSASYDGKNPVELNDEYPIGSGYTMTNYIRQGLISQRQAGFLQVCTEAVIKDVRGANDKNIKWYKENIKW